MPRQARAPIVGLMGTVAEIGKLALNLPEKQRALLAAQLLESLPPFLHDEDEGVGEALRRDAELEADPLLGISLERLREQVQQRRQP